MILNIGEVTSCSNTCGIHTLFICSDVAGIMENGFGMLGSACSILSFSIVYDFIQGLYQRHNFFRSHWLLKC